MGIFFILITPAIDAAITSKIVIHFALAENSMSFLILLMPAHSARSRLFYHRLQALEAVQGRCALLGLDAPRGHQSRDQHHEEGAEGAGDRI